MALAAARGEESDWPPRYAELEAHVSQSQGGNRVNDTIEFHGAKLNVEVLNMHRSRLFRNMNISCAADRLVRLEEGGIDVRFDSHLVTVELRKHQRGEMPPYSHFVSELPRKLLKNFPVMLQFDKRRRFTGLVIFKPNPEKARRRSK